MANERVRLQHRLRDEPELWEDVTSDNQATKITIDGTDVYVAIAPPASLQADPVWQCQKIDTAAITIKWADGNTDFDNVATDLTALSYS